VLPVSIQNRSSHPPELIGSSGSATVPYRGKKNKLSGWVVKCGKVAWERDRRSGLNAATAVPAAAVGGDRIGACPAVDPVDAEEGGNEPEKSRQEGERDNGLPLSTCICPLEVDAVPIEDIS
jgi:hypothetical protein